MGSRDAFFFVIRLVLSVGAVVGWLVLIGAVCRIAAAQERISEILAVGLLGKRPKARKQDYDVQEPAECMKCGGTIPGGQTRCPQCGWSYELSADKSLPHQ